ncbi:ribosome maturation factor RimM [[Clostridium] innocuum]|nr:ribosome maturation factor RimM [[Clostridium] innocuum]MCR0576128.1 ribosome maturation factor RimM [[Clostridium] innocuum]
MKEINIGMLVNTHGLRGEMKVKVLTDFPELRFHKGAVVHLQLAQEQLDLKVQHVHESKGQLLVKFEGYDDINQVEGWKGSMLTIREEELQELNEYEAYFHELQDAVVYDMEGVQLGTVSEIIETGANAILRVKTKDKDILIPFVRAFVKEFDRKSKVMKVELMEGLV